MGTWTSIVEPLQRRLQQTLVRWMQRYERQFDQETWRFVVLSWVGCIGMPAYYLIWTYWFPQHFDSLSLRLVGAALCLPAPWAARVLGGRLRSSYLFVGVTYVLPFQFAFLYLMNHGSEIWGQSLLIALIVLFHFQFAWALLSCTVGVLCACALFAAIGDAAVLTSHALLAHLPVYVFTIIVISVAKVGRRVLANEKLAGMAQGLATVSHELRTPLISVDANVRGIHRRLSACTSPSAADWHEMGEAMLRIQHEVRHMNHMVDLFLLSATAVREQLEADEQVSMKEVVESVIRRYPFTAQAQRDAVKVDIRTDFIFAGKHELSVVILLNLLRNALKALQRAGKGGADRRRWPARHAASAVHRHRLRHRGAAAAADLQALLFLPARFRVRHRAGAVQGHHRSVERQHPLRVARMGLYHLRPGISGPEHGAPGSSPSR
jgi:two-component system CAI-1 autoinducer sensor kinase/phosphatase CqsS